MRGPHASDVWMDGQPVGLGAATRFEGEVRGMSVKIDEILEVLAQVCITGENEQPFRKLANRDFGRSRTPISDEAEQSFRLMPNTHFG